MGRAVYDIGTVAVGIHADLAGLKSRMRQRYVPYLVAGIHVGLDGYHLGAIGVFCRSLLSVIYQFK